MTDVECRRELGEGTSGPSGGDADAPQTPASNKRRRRASAGLTGGAFAEIEVQECAGARREAGGARPPPTLPRMYIELEPRVLTAADAPLHDYAGEPIGLLTDYHVTWRLQVTYTRSSLKDDSIAATHLETLFKVL